MIILKQISLLAVVGILLLFSCANDPMANGENPSSSALTLSLSINNPGTESVTRVAIDAEPEEKQVAPLYLFFFESNDDRTGIMVDYVKLDSPSLTAETPIPTADKSITVSGRYHVIGVANTNRYMPENWADTWTGVTEEYFSKNAFATFPSGGILANDLLMYGYALKNTGDGRVDMKLTRNVARFDVVNKAAGYELTGVELRNIYNKSSITGEATPDYSKDNIAARAQSYSATPTTTDKVIAKLYGFENRSTTPELDDEVTTCLILELKSLTNTTTTFHRINISPEKTAQNLKRNNIYQITITDVSGEGDPDAGAAYKSKKQHLSYTINNWDLGDNGLIVSDSYSILAVPVKTVQIGKEGDTKQYAITTFSTLTNPSPLSIKNKDLPQGFSVSLTGNTLSVAATPLESEAEERAGSITFAYAGLEATVNITQSSRVETYLNLTYEEGWSGLLGPTEGLGTKAVMVSASGPWTAMFIGDNGFSFSASELVTEIKSGALTSNSFHIYTSSPNPSNTKPRNAFVIVSLDENPVNCVGVVSISQAVTGDISISPMVESVVFDGSGIIVSPAGVTSFTVESATGNINSAAITSGNERFDCVLAGNSLTITAKGKNSSANNYTGMLKVTDDQNASLTINLIQRPLSLSVSTTAPTTVEAAGGETGSFNLKLDEANAKWRASVETKTVNGEIFNHKAILVYADGREVGANDELTADTPIKVRFPKIYFPNREVDIRAVVTFTTLNGGTASYTFAQNKLTSKGVIICNSGNGYGTLNNSIMANYRNRLQAMGGTYSPSSANVTAYPTATTTYAHFGNGSVTSYNWTPFETFRNEKEGITVLVCDRNGNNYVSVLNQDTSPLNKSGYTVTGSLSSGTGNASVVLPDMSTRIGQLLTTQGKTPIEPGAIGGFYRDGTSTELSVYPASAVPVMVSASNPGRYVMAIDPVNRLIFCGDSQVFSTITGSYAYRGTFMNNLVEYVVNAAKYGTHFTDMLIDNAEVPEPWSPAWSTNAWPK